MCFVQAWKIGFFAKAIALWLSLCNTGICWIPKSPTKRANHIASLLVSDATIYLASVVDKDVHFWKVDLQEIAPLANKNMYPDVDLLVSTQPQ